MQCIMCMIELWGGERHLDEAFALTSDCPFKPSVNMWAVLLIGCRVNNNLVLGKLPAEKIYDMKIEKLIDYAVLLNVYKSLGKPEEAASLFNT